jgi:DNA-binding LacI/PurR family transcriptional regulator
MGKVRLADIAEKVGVSTVTVHNALLGNKGVSDALRDRIKQVADELGYQVRADREKQESEDTLWTIGVLVAENYLAQYETFYWKIYQEMALEATEKHCLTAVEVLKKEDELTTLKMPSCIESHRVDALIVIGEIGKAYITKLRSRANVPVIFLDFYDKDLAQDAVITDNYYGMFLLTEYMFDQGITELGYVGSIYATSSIMDRYCGFMKSMLLHHKNLQPEWLIEDRDALGQMNIELPERLPKGLVCNCDLAAYMLIDKLQERGIRVPEDISVVGFDNYLYPGLADRRITTYEVNTRAMTKVAINKVLKQIKNPQKGHGLDIVSGHMVIKESVKSR